MVNFFMDVPISHPIFSFRVEQKSLFFFSISKLYLFSLLGHYVYYLSNSSVLHSLFFIFSYFFSCYKILLFAIFYVTRFFVWFLIWLIDISVINFAFLFSFSKSFYFVFIFLFLKLYAFIVKLSYFRFSF